MLDQIVASHPGRIAAVEWHLVNNGSPMYSAEARAKSRLYPPPQNGGYYTPWLWCDGWNKGSGYSNWNAYAEAAMLRPACVGLNLTGSYDPALRTGQLQIEFVNDSTEAISATALVVVTEDSIYYAAANGDLWHSHVCRDYIPTETGTIIEIPALGRDTLVQDFVLDPSWNEARCNLVVYLQATDTQPDSSRPAYNAATAPVLQFSGIAQPGPTWNPGFELTATPNPILNQTRFSIPELGGRSCQFSVLAPNGSLVRQWSGRISEVVWDGLDRFGRRVPAGVYLCELRCESQRAVGKVLLLGQ
jgi:hypothetical protein